MKIISLNWKIIVVVKETRTEGKEDVSRMDVVKDYIDCINIHWIVIVTTGMYMHLRQICIIGLCLDEENIETSPPFDPSYASLIFMFSLLCLLAEYKLWPSSLKEPPTQLLYIYDVSNSLI